MKERLLTSETIVQIPLSPWLNIFALRGSQGVVLVDAGVQDQADLVLERLAEHGITPQDVRLILITHGHTDHFGSAAELRERTGAPVAVHAHDAEALRNSDNDLTNAKADNKLVDWLMRIIGAKLVGRVPPVEPDIVFEDEWRLDEYGVAARVLPTPGHTRGSVSILLDSGEVIVGDTVIGGMMGLLSRPSLPIIAWDSQRNRESVQQLVELSPTVVYSSHGGPFTNLLPTSPGFDWRILWIAPLAFLGLMLLWRLLKPKAEQDAREKE